ncbi:MAG: hypothetical protein M0Z27_03260 [Thermaerobacter sp.]|jgi:hypothetical protein|nr:hypothetical protein [Thermaerobacter sp.]MDA8145067.1 hypothetical protein [Thermaerobacter sp.]
MDERTPEERSELPAEPSAHELPAADPCAQSMKVASGGGGGIPWPVTAPPGAPDPPPPWLAGGATGFASGPFCSFLAGLVGNNVVLLLAGGTTLSGLLSAVNDCSYLTLQTCTPSGALASSYVPLAAVYTVAKTSSVPSNCRQT